MMYRALKTLLLATLSLMLGLNFAIATVAAPTVTGLSPSNGATTGGTLVTITGTDFTGATAVTFGGSVATNVTVVSATQITASSPAGSLGNVNVTVTTPNGTSPTGQGNQFTYQYAYNPPAPALTSVTPSTGVTTGGTSVVITGTDFTGATAVTFGGTPATSFTEDSSTQITAIAPAGSAGAVAVAVTTSGGTGSLANAYTYTAATVQSSFDSSQTWLGEMISTSAPSLELGTLFAFNDGYLAWVEPFSFPPVGPVSPNAEPVSTPTSACISVGPYSTNDDAICLASNSSVPLQFAGSFDANTVMVSSMGRFTGVSAAFGGNWQRMVFGDFNIQHNSETDSGTAGLNARVAWQTTTSPKTVLGYFVDGHLAHSNIGGVFEGGQNSIGVSVGGYGVHTLENKLKLTGFLSLGAGRNNLDISDTVLSLESDYITRSAIFGTALSGLIEEEDFQVRPKLSINFGRTWIGNVDFTGRAYGVVDDTLTLDADKVTLANMMLTTEVRVPLDGLTAAKSLQVMTFAPRLICEQITKVESEENCGGGAEVGFSGTSEDRMSTVSAMIRADRIGGSTRSSLQLGLETQF